MTENNKIVYTQSGKPNEQEVTGSIDEGQALVCTAYRMGYNGQTFDNGIVAVFDGPSDFNEYPISLTDGACTLVTTDAVQAKLDSMAIDFARGDRTEDGTAWTYKPWALSTVLTGEYAWNDMSGLNADNDSYPNNPPVK